jgi:large subunit ribosomal protein L6
MKYIEKFFFTHTIQIPLKVKIKKIRNSLFFEGPLGLIEIDICKIDSLGLGFFRINTELNQLEIFVRKNSKNSKAFFGSLLSLYQNNIHGVCQGFLVYLELTGVGFRAIIHDSEEVNQKSQITNKSDHLDIETTSSIQKIEFKVGQSHEIIYEMPKNIRAFSLKPTLLCLYGLDKMQITQVASEIRNFRPPEPYKGKGIRYKDEVIRIKVGKKK